MASRTSNVSKQRAATQRPGRPQGGGSHPPVSTVSEATVTPSTCPKCGSPAREKYLTSTTQEYLGERIIRKRTKCSDCGQVRIDRFIERLKVNAAG